MSFEETLTAAAGATRDVVRAALENGTTVRIAGAGRWLDAGRPVKADHRLEPPGGEIIEYVPGDLTITVGAGTTLSAVAEVTGEHSQWLPLDPFGGAAGSLGATVATASAGPLAHAFGTPRDQVIGLGFVTGRGDYVRSGGRVVKNVAGFDLTRLLIGSWGTLGVITDVTLRLRAKPDTDRTIALVMSDDPVRFRQTLDAVNEAPLTPLAMELVNAEVARAIGSDGDTLLLVRLGGNRALVSSQRDELARLGEVRSLDTAVWTALSTVEPPGSAVVRYSTQLADVGALWRRLERQLAPANALLHATLSRGIVRCIVPAASAQQLPALFRSDDGSDKEVFERLPEELWPVLASSAFDDPLSLRVRQAFDPGMLLNPGILGEAPA